MSGMSFRMRGRKKKKQKQERMIMENVTNNKLIKEGTYINRYRIFFSGGKQVKWLKKALNYDGRTKNKQTDCRGRRNKKIEGTIHRKFGANKIYMSFLYAFIISCTSVNYHLGSYVVLESQSSFPLITTNSPQFRGKV